jgi:hypothetical protein
MVRRSIPPVRGALGSRRTEQRLANRIALQSGFADPSKVRQDSTEDVMNRLRNSKTVRLVEAESEAAAVVEILDRKTHRDASFWTATYLKSTLVVRLAPTTEDPALP